MNLDLEHYTYHEELNTHINQYSDKKWTDNFTLDKCILYCIFTKIHYML